MYLNNSVRDFEALIESINVELQWDASEKCVKTIFLDMFV